MHWIKENKIEVYQDIRSNCWYFYKVIEAWCVQLVTNVTVSNGKLSSRGSVENKLNYIHNHEYDCMIANGTNHFDNNDVVSSFTRSWV